MKKNIKKFAFIGIVLAGIISLGITNINQKPLVASEESIAAQANKITSNVWNLDIKSIEFTVGTEDQKFANVEFSMTNTSSLDKEFTPSGKIVSIVGTSGKTYEAPMHHSLAKAYTESKSDRIKMDPQYKPGEFKFAIGLMVDNSEENFTKVIYQDESGKNFEIPIQGISPKIKPLPTNGK